MYSGTPTALDAGDRSSAGMITSASAATSRISSSVRTVSQATTGASMSGSVRVPAARGLLGGSGEKPDNASWADSAASSGAHEAATPPRAAVAAITLRAPRRVMFSLIRCSSA